MVRICRLLAFGLSYTRMRDARHETTEHSSPNTTWLMVINVCEVYTQAFVQPNDLSLHAHLCASMP